MKNLVYILIFIVLSTIIYPQSKGGYWSFPGNGNDSATWDSNNNIGTLINSASYQTNNGINNQYLALDTIAGKDYLLVNDDDDLDFDKENIGISLWIYPTSITDVHFIINKGDQFTQPKTTNYSLRISKTKNIEFLIRDQNDKAQKVASSFSVEEGQWQFVAVFYDFVNKTVYMWNEENADPIDTLPFSTEPRLNDDPLAIGSWYKSDSPNSSTNDFEGWIDEVKISGRQEDIFPSQQVGIESENESQGNLQFNLYPNPISKSNRNSIKINFNTHQNGDYLIKVYSILGREIYSESFNSIGINHHINLLFKDINSGMYFVSLINSNRTQTQKLLILK